MWVFLDDFADSAGTKVFRIGRIVACLALLAAALLIGLNAFGKSQALRADAAEKMAQVTDLNNQIAEKTRELNQLRETQAVREYSPANVCDAVSMLQSAYGNNNTNTSATVIAENAAKTMEQLKGYAMADAIKTSWFNGPMERYGWRAVNSGAASAEAETPILWECVSDKGTLLAVTTGTYYGEEDRCGNFRIYLTQEGQNKSTASSDGNSGPLVSGIQGSVQNLIKDGPIPAGYNDTNRANSGDQSWNGTTVILSAEESAFRATLSGEEATQFENLNHASRQKYMADKGFTSGSGVVDVTGNSNTDAAKDRPLTNDEALKSILGMS